MINPYEEMMDKLRLIKSATRECLASYFANKRFNIVLEFVFVGEEMWWAANWFFISNEINRYW